MERDLGQDDLARTGQGLLERFGFYLQAHCAGTRDSNIGQLGRGHFGTAGAAELDMHDICLDRAQIGAAAAVDVNGQLLPPAAGSSAAAAVDDDRNSLLFETA